MATPISQTKSFGVPALSRYRNTRLYEDRDLAQTYFGVWRVPNIRATKPESIHRVSPDEKCRPDLIAFHVYGNPSLFWAIAIRNGILLPIRDITIGQVLVCPHLDDIMASLLASASNNPGTF